MTFDAWINYIKNVPVEELNNYYCLFEKRAKNSDVVHIAYLTLGNLTVKIENHVAEFAKTIETQFAYCINYEADSYDFTVCVWRDNVASLVADFAQNTNRLFFYAKDSETPSIKVYLEMNRLEAYNPETRTYYISRNDFSDETIPRMGHLFVKQIYQMAKTDNQALVHSAAVGIDNNGVLICARGGKGKSTLAISALLDGFQYVSDDYLILSKTDRLYAHPIYSTTNLYPQIQEKMSGLNARFIHYNFWQPQKHTLDISTYHDRFVDKLPITVAIFPQICDEEIPSIDLMDEMEKGKAIVQLIHSTISQIHDTQNSGYVKTLMFFVSGLDFYRINLSPDLKANVKLLKQFIIKRRNNYV